METNPGPIYCTYCGKKINGGLIAASHLMNNHFQIFILVQMFIMNVSEKAMLYWIKRQSNVQRRMRKILTWLIFTAGGFEI